MNAEIGDDVERAARILERGGLVAIPTETVYGLAANALDAEACLRIFEAKRRPAFDPLIVHVRARAALDVLARGLPAAAEALCQRFWPGPLTLVLDKSPLVPDIATSGLETVAVRQPAHPIARALLERLSFPLAAPSANRFGLVSPTTAQHVADQLGDDLEYILDGGACEVGVESTIVGWEDGSCVLYRPGGVALEDIEACIGAVGVAQRRVLPAAPGMLAAHYAPRTQLVVVDSTDALASLDLSRAAVLTFQRDVRALASIALSPNGDLSEAARRLFAALRELDRAGAERIVAERLPEVGLGRAINDRLRRAAAARAKPA